MEFEIEYERVAENDAVILSRSQLWLLRVLYDHSAIEFDTKLTNRLRLLTSCINEVKFDITSMLNARILLSTDVTLKNSFGSLVLWLYDFLDSRPELMSHNAEFLKQTNITILTQLGVYPSIFCAQYYRNQTRTTFYSKIILSKHSTDRTQHVDHFTTLIAENKNNKGISIFHEFIERMNLNCILQLH